MARHSSKNLRKQVDLSRQETASSCAGRGSYDSKQERMRQQAGTGATASRSRCDSKQRRLPAQASEVGMQCMYVGFLTKLAEHTEQVTATQGAGRCVATQTSLQRR